MKNAGIKIFPSKGRLETTSNYHVVKEIIVNLTEDEVQESFNTANSSYGTIFPSTSWEVSILQFKYFKITDFQLESAFMSFMLPLNSIYKDRLKRFIHLIQDTGLYNYWKSRIAYELYIFEEGEKPRRRIIVENEETLRILDINFFIYPFLFLIILLMFAFVVFLMEIFWKLLKNICF